MKTIIHTFIICILCGFLINSSFAQNSNPLPDNASFLTGNWTTTKDLLHTSSGKTKQGTNYHYKFKVDTVGYISWTGSSPYSYNSGMGNDFNTFKFKWSYSKSAGTLKIVLSKKITEIWHLVNVTNSSIDMVLYQDAADSKDGSTPQIKEERWLSKN